MLPFAVRDGAEVTQQAGYWAEKVLSTSDLDTVCRSARKRHRTGATYRAAAVGQDRAGLVQALRALQDRTPHPDAFGPHQSLAPSNVDMVLVWDVRTPPPLPSKAKDVLQGKHVDHIVLVCGRETTTIDHQWAALLPSESWTYTPTVEEAARVIAHRQRSVSSVVVEVGSDHLAPDLVDLLPDAHVTASGLSPLSAARAAAEVHLWHESRCPARQGPAPASLSEGQSALLSVLGRLTHLPEGVCASQNWWDLRLGGAELARMVQLLRTAHGWAHLTCKKVLTATSFSALVHSLRSPQTLMPYQTAPPCSPPPLALSTPSVIGRSHR